MPKNAIQHCLALWSSSVLIFLAGGCAGIRDCKYEVGQKIRTHQAWNSYNRCHDECFTCDYRDGWKAGYFDVATGGEGIPPVIAPKRYWKPPVFFQHDPSRRDDWYCGYQDGAACAKTQPDFHYLKLWLPDSPPVQMTGFSHSTLQPPDECPVAPPQSVSDISPEPALVAPPTEPSPGTEPPANSATDPVTTPEPPADAPASERSPDASTSEPDAASGQGNDYESDPPATSSLERHVLEHTSRNPAVTAVVPSEDENRSYVDRLIDNVAGPEMVRAFLSTNQARDLDPKQGDGGVRETLERHSTQSHRSTPAGQAENRRISSQAGKSPEVTKRRSAASNELPVAIIE